jgi:hypothetical protein
MSFAIPDLETPRDDNASIADCLNAWDITEHQQAPNECGQYLRIGERCERKDIDRLFKYRKF